MLSQARRRLIAATRPRLATAVQKVGYWSNGEEKLGSGSIIQNRDPATGELLAEVHGCTNEEVRATVEAAQDGAKAWASMTGGERS